MKNKKEAQSAAKISADAAAQAQQRDTDELATGAQDNPADETPQNVEQQLNAAAELNASETEQSETEQNETAQADRTEQAQAVKEKRTAKQWLKYFAHRYFIEAFSGMALGLFCTLIIGTIIGEVGFLINEAGKNAFGDILSYIGQAAKSIMGAGIGVGIAHSLKANKLTAFSAAGAGMVGANITNIFTLSGIHVYGAQPNPSIGVGDPVGAFVAAVTAIEITKHVEGKTPVDIIVVPLTAIFTGTVGAIALGIPFGILFALLGKGVSLAIGWEPVSFGILIAVIMGLLLTLPTSSAAFGIMIFSPDSPLLINAEHLQDNIRIGAAAACAGCCAHMVGFAVASFRENRWGGLVSQGIGTSMLQIPNLGKNPRILIPAVAASAVAGPLASAAFKIMCDPTGSGMGTAGLVGVINTFIASANSHPWWYVLIAVLVCYIIVPAAVALGVSEIMRKKKWIKFGDMKI